MKTFTSVLASSLLLALPAAAENALVYLSGSPSIDDPPASLSPSDTRLVIAQRLGLSRYHDLNDAGEDTLRAINAYGSSSKSILSTGQQEHSRQAFVVIEGVVEPEGFFKDLASSHFTIESPPLPSVNADFLSDLNKQSISEYGPDTTFFSAFHGEDSTTTLDSWYKGRKDDARDLILHDQHLMSIAKEAGIKSESYRNALLKTRQSLEKSLSSQDQSSKLTILLMPHQTSSGSIFKRTASLTWGKYSHSKREESDSGSGRVDFTPSSDDFVDTEDPAFSKDNDKEAPEKPATKQSAPVKGAAEDDDDDGDKDLKKDPATPPKPPKGILPACFATADACTDATHNCSGHGKCIKKYSNPVGGEGNVENCFSCACQATTEDRGKGYKTIQWAGPACQKKDVSMPFWLLGGTTVGLMAAVAWGVGLLYSMGSEDLPSVIGAGVSNAGARAK